MSSPDQRVKKKRKKKKKKKTQLLTCAVCRPNVNHSCSTKLLVANVLLQHHVGFVEQLFGFRTDRRVIKDFWIIAIGILSLHQMARVKT
jgi:hypothetical protein